MHLIKTDKSSKGWSIGAWNSSLPISIGYANLGIDEPHFHQQITEIYLVASGQAKARINQNNVQLVAGDILIVEAGEAHTFLSSSSNYFHFVLHIPSLVGDQAPSG